MDPIRIEPAFPSPLTGQPDFTLHYYLVSIHKLYLTAQYVTFYDAITICFHGSAKADLKINTHRGNRRNHDEKGY